MLVEFRVQNHRSLGSEQALSLRPASGLTAEDARLRHIDGGEILPVAALYGANGSGKSNVLGALEFARTAVVRSHRLWAPDGGVPREAFAWGTQRHEPSLFELTFYVGRVRHEFGFVCDDQRFLEEWLYVWPSGRKQTWFEREGDAFKFGEHLKGENRIVEQLTRPNALFLSTAVQARHQQLDPIFRWFSAMRTLTGPAKRTKRPAAHSVERWLFQNRDSGTERSGGKLETPLDTFRELLRAADIGIVDFKLEAGGEDRGAWSPKAAGRLLLQHRSSAGDAWLPLEEESQGTQRLCQMAPAFIDALAGGRLLIADELESSLHPLLGLHIVKTFNDPRTNPRNAQLIFTTHDTNLLGSLLGEPPLRRDQVWLTEKDGEGATHLYPLTDYKPRKSENLERGYLQGRYGAIPFLGDLAPSAGEDRGGQ